LIFLKLKKPPPELVDFIKEKMKNVKSDYRQMFGYPAYFINGNMFAGVFSDKLILRLSEEDIEKAKKISKEIAPFEPMQGRPMKGYIALTKQLYMNDSIFNELLYQSIKYASTLPPKHKGK
jgi:TfoX/Sxy family transcriptional regulator of competence genes